MKFLSACLLLFISLSVFGQSPGFQGKKVYVEYQPIFRFSNVDYYDDEAQLISKGLLSNNRWKYNLNHRVALHYTFSRSGVIGIDGTFGKSRFLNESLYNTFTDEDLYEAKGYRLGIVYKQFNFKEKGYIAPVGNFFEARLFLLHVEGERYGVISYDPELQREIVTPYEPARPLTDNYNGMGISLGWGIQTVWFKRLVPSYVCGVSVIPGFFIDSLKDIDPNLDTNFTPIKDMAHQYVGGILVGRGLYIDVKLGIGILLF